MKQALKNFAKILKKKITEAENILICIQKGNDLDTMSSAFGLTKLIELNESEKKVKILQINVNNTLLGDVKSYGYDVAEENLTGEKTLFITVDINSPEQIYPANLTIAKACGSVVKIDHHSDSEDLGLNEETLNIPEFSSCSEIIWELAKNMEWKRNEEIAKIIFHGLYSDSHYLVGEKVSYRTFKRIAEIGKLGVDTKGIMRRLNTQSIKEMHIVADVIKNSWTVNNLILLDLIPDYVYKYFPVNFKQTANGRIYQKKLLTFPLNVIEATTRVNTIIYIHYSLMAPFNTNHRFIFVVLVKPNEKIEKLLLDNNFRKHRNRYSRKITSQEIRKFIEENEKLLSE